MNASALRARGEPTDAADIESVRAFNRFYTRQLGLLDQGLLGSEYTLTESRVLHELAHSQGCTATDIARELGIDFGYLSRILKKLERHRLIERTRSTDDGRRSSIKLTRQGRAAFEPLDTAAKAQIDSMLTPISRPERIDLIRSMQTVRRVLQPREPSPAPAPLLRPLRVGDIGWIIHRQGLLYAQEYGWDANYEALVAQILAEFVQRFDPQAENAWIAEQEGEMVGSAFLVRASAQVAKLRLLYVEPHARGFGTAGLLVATCVDFARSKGYRTLTLWTHDVLVSARKLYEAAGFKLVKEEPHHSFGKDLLGQTWELAL